MKVWNASKLTAHKDAVCCLVQFDLRSSISVILIRRESVKMEDFRTRTCSIHSRRRTKHCLPKEDKSKWKSLWSKEVDKVWKQRQTSLNVMGEYLINNMYMNLKEKQRWLEIFQLKKRVNIKWMSKVSTKFKEPISVMPMWRHHEDFFPVSSPKMH